MENNKVNLKTVFMGTPEFGAIVLEGLIKAGYKLILVVTSPDKPVGRKQILTPPPAKVMAQRYKIPVVHNIEDIKTDLIVVASYGKILPKEILDIPKYGCLNVHPSLLPKYRGSSPIQQAILNGDKETGVTIILMDEQIDHGPILAQRKTIIGSNEEASQLHDRLAVLGTELLIDIIPDWILGKMEARTQDETRATYAKILKREDGEINWQKKPEEIERQIRALNPWPGTYTTYSGKRLKILKAGLSKNRLLIKEVQLGGKKPMSFQTFLRGHKDFIKNKTICSGILI